MSAPTPTSVGVSIAAGAITISGSILGLQYEYLMAGMFGGLVALSIAEPTSKWKMATTVASSSVMAGYATPVAVAFAHTYAVWTSAISYESFAIFCSASIGISTHTAIPAVLKWIKSFVGAKK